MSDERELERHNKIMKQIEEATTLDELPKISVSSILSYLATNVYFNNKKISQTMFQPFINKIIETRGYDSEEVKRVFISIVKSNYPGVTDNEILIKYSLIVNGKKFEDLIIELGEKVKKTYEIMDKENLSMHNEVVKQINNAYEIKDLPKVGLSNLNSKILKAVNSTNIFSPLKASEVKELTKVYLEGKDYCNIERAVETILSSLNLSVDELDAAFYMVMQALDLDKSIIYTAEEIRLKSKRVLKIYKMDHEETMENIKNARRISELPPNLTFSTLSNYIGGNTTIYTNDDRIKSEDLKILTGLLMKGKQWNSTEVLNELKRLALEKYPDKEDAYILLYKKLSSLPKTYYLVEEIKYSLSRQKEFIGKGSSNVNVYFIPNDKAPIDGGRFYNCYINRVGQLDLSNILPLDLDSIVPKGMDIDSIEWYVQEYYDDTFKAAGGIILYRDETIGKVSIFRPNDGKVGVTLEEKTKMDEITDLDRQIEEKKEIISKLDEEIDTKEKTSTEMRESLKRLFKEYKNKALKLQKEFLEQVSELGTMIDGNEPETNDPMKLTLKDEGHE